MIVADPMPTFPTCPTFKFTVAPDYLVKIITRESGHERRDRKWANALRSFIGVPIGPRPEADIEALLDFWLAIGGTATTFRFRDWSDYKSGAMGADPTALDQLFGVLPGSPARWQLQKTYSAGGAYQAQRAITRPRGASITVANGAGAVQDAATWSLNEATGVLATLAGFVGLPGSWGGIFDVPVRFAATPQIELIDYKISQLYQPATFLEDRAG